MSDERLLIVDDTPGVCDLIRTVAEDLGYAVDVATNREEFAAALVDASPTAITLDLAMPGGDGIEFLRMLGERDCRARIAVISGFDAKVVGSAMRLGQGHGLKMIGSLRKPFAVADLEDLLAVPEADAFRPSAADLRAAIAAGHIVPYFQPKIALGDKAADAPIRAAEALARWEHPEHGLIPPGAFIPLAEREGLIAPLTWSMIGQTAKHMAGWWADGLEVTVSVNVAASLLTDLDYPDKLATHLVDNGATPAWFILEVTESGAMEDASRAMDVLTRLRLKGFHLSCDDFGTGYSSLVQLYRMPFGELKIDRSFVIDSIEHEEARTIIRASIDLAHNLGLSVCAEGVENQEVLDFLTAEGCDRAQGFFIGRPVPASEFVERAAKSGSRPFRVAG